MKAPTRMPKATTCRSTGRGGHGMPCPYDCGIMFSHRLWRSGLSLLTGPRQKLAIEEGELPRLFDNVTTNDLTALAVPSTVNGCA